MRKTALAAALVCALSACTGEVDPGPAQPTAAGSASASVDTGPNCPAPKSTSPKWPADVPTVIPRPPGLTIERVDRSKGNVTQVRTLVPMSIRQSVLFIVREFPKAGFTLGRGDAEATEVDAPFQRGEALRGLVRVFITTDQCQTLWLYAVVKNTNAPYDITYTPPPSSTPLPFG